MKELRDEKIVEKNNEGSRWLLMFWFMTETGPLIPGKNSLKEIKHES